MARERQDRGTMPMLPDDARPCVWMDAGVIVYKLCDRGFDCEHCPLDEALRGARPASRPVGSDAAASEPPFPDDRRYHPRHTWVASSDGPLVRCGMDSFAARLLDRVASVVLPAPGSRLLAGRVAFWVEDASEVIPMRAPVGGTVVRTNEGLHRSPSRASSDPYGEGWLFDVRRDDPVPDEGLLDAAGMRDLADRQLRSLHRHAAAARSRLRREVGPTLADGGVPLATLREILGLPRYHRLVAKFF